MYHPGIIQKKNIHRIFTYTVPKYLSSGNQRTKKKGEKPNQ